MTLWARSTYVKGRPHIWHIVTQADWRGDLFIRLCQGQAPLRIHRCEYQEPRPAEGACKACCAIVARREARRASDNEQAPENGGRAKQPSSGACRE